METFTDRLHILVALQEAGRHTVFAKNAGIKIGTFQNYIKGRKPSFDALLNICETYGVNMNWLIAGIGEKYLTDQVQEEKVPSDCFQEVAELQEWLAEISEEDPDRRVWFKMELRDNFPLFKEWLKKRDQTTTKTGNRRAA